jgi:hypothetical protein
MDIMNIDFGFATGSLVGILFLTNVIKNMFPIPKRFIILIPLSLGVLAGILRYVIDTDLGDLETYKAIAGAIYQGLSYGGVAIAVWLVKKKAILNQV